MPVLAQWREIIPELTGYKHPDYARSLSHLGEPVYLENAGGWLISRRIPGSDYHDLMGTYPLFMCDNPAAVDNDLSSMEREYVSLSIVPVGGEFGTDSDVSLPFKEHYIVDLQQDWRMKLSSNHRRNIAKAQKLVEVELVEYDESVLDEWCELYDNLRRRHGIDGFADFGRDAFRMQLQLPGSYLFQSRSREGVNGMGIFYAIDNSVYYHLAAYSDTGYSQRASFAIFDSAIEKFAADGIKELNLGGGAGLSVDKDDGLARFKAGWASRTKQSMFIGKVLNRRVYEELAKKNARQTNFFPAYRANGQN